MIKIIYNKKIYKNGLWQRDIAKIIYKRWYMIKIK